MVCQAGCAGVAVACYAGAGAVMGTVTAGVGTPAAILTCNSAYEDVARPIGPRLLSQLHNGKGKNNLVDSLHKTNSRSRNLYETGHGKLFDEMRDEGSGTQHI